MQPYSKAKNNKEKAKSINTKTRETQKNREVWKDEKSKKEHMIYLPVEAAYQAST